tara:strand:- start:1380 stop:2099 length:720 start_codon:yes stop_codon:yes gene_type:complete
MKNKFGFVLVKPQLGENIGACARSMKNFGFKNLSIVSPKFYFPNHKAKTTAVGAFDIINQTKVFNNTENAVGKFDIVISLSARKRHINKKHITINDLLNILFTNKEKKIGFMFGPEASGLSNHDLSYSNYILQIPTVSNFKSINLSHSVTIICFEIFKILNKKSFKKKGKNIKISSKSKISSIINYLINLLESKEFFKPKEKRKSMILNINNLFYKIEPNDKELRILASILSTLSKNKP